MAYFDPSDPFDGTLLPPGLRSSGGVLDYAAQVEREVIEEFTYLSGTTETVGLVGYDADETLAAGYNATRSAWTGFARLFRKVIAKVVTHRLRYGERDPSVISQGRGGRAKTFRRVDPDWPVFWKSDLSDYFAEGSPSSEVIWVC